MSMQSVRISDDKNEVAAEISEHCGDLDAQVIEERVRRRCNDRDADDLIDVAVSVVGSTPKSGRIEVYEERVNADVHRRRDER